MQEIALTQAELDALQTSGALEETIEKDGVYVRYAETVFDSFEASGGDDPFGDVEDVQDGAPAVILRSIDVDHMLDGDEVPFSQQDLTIVLED